MNQQKKSADILPPVVFFVFNRPDTTQAVFSCIREAQPSTLFLIADGPRENNASDAANCIEVRDIISHVDWNCQVFTSFADENLGCKSRISSGLDWVFKHVDRAIILEDDCLPHHSFFPFCRELLDRYQDDERIMSISGDNFQKEPRRTVHSYYFSRYPHCWGWATWRRAWQHYDADMKLWPYISEEGWLYDLLDDAFAVRYWHNKFQKTYRTEIDSWDYAWTLACWLQSGLCILPNINLVSNIGFDNRGTHTRNHVSPFAGLPTYEMQFPLDIPPVVIRDVKADHFTQFHQFGMMSRSLRKIKSALHL